MRSVYLGFTARDLWPAHINNVEVRRRRRATLLRSGFHCARSMGKVPVDAVLSVTGSLRLLEYDRSETTSALSRFGVIERVRDGMRVES